MCKFFFVLKPGLSTYSPLTLLSQRRLAQIARNTFLRYKIIGAPKKFKKWPRLLFSLGRQSLKLTKHVPSLQSTCYFSVFQL